VFSYTIVKDEVYIFWLSFVGLQTPDRKWRWQMPEATTGKKRVYIPQHDEI
jgi:hypothetical protein